MFIGCFSTYNVTDFSSKEKFYEDFNNSAGNKSLNIVLKNDSSITAVNGANISHDSLIFAMQIQRETKILSKDEVRIIRYKGQNIFNTIYFKNGDSLIANNIYILSDSSIFAEYFDSTFEHLPIKIIKEVSYKNHWPAIIPGIVCGILGSFIIAGVGETDSRNSDSGIFASGAAMFYGVPLGIITGGIIGWYIGYSYTYQFNP